MNTDQSLNPEHSHTNERGLGNDALPEELLGLLVANLGTDPALHRRWLDSYNRGLGAVPRELIVKVHGLNLVLAYLARAAGSDFS